MFGQAGVDAVLKELKQLHDRRVPKLKMISELTVEKRKAALEYLMFPKKKRCGTIKGHGRADGHKQQVYTSREEASSPTVAIKLVMLSCIIDAMEGRDGAAVDIPGAFMQDDMDETVHMRLHGTMAQLIAKINLKLYRKYIQLKNGKPVLYVELAKALYGTLRAALLFWRKLLKQLIKWGYEINPYDWCVANNIF